MKSSRYDKIGIKQVIRLEWMDKALDLLLAELPTKDIRSELMEYLSNKKQSGGEGQRGKEAIIKALSILMQAWCTPAKEITALRDDCLSVARKIPQNKRLFLHWSMISAAYPFWLSTAKQTGRLLKLQDQTTQKQIVSRLKEQYGDRETIARYGRYVVRSFIAWGVLKDTKAKGFYAKGTQQIISSQTNALLLFESSLLSIPEGKSTIRSLLSSPGLFPFSLPNLSGDLISMKSPRLEIVHHGLDDEIVKLSRTV